MAPPATSGTTPATPAVVPTIVETTTAVPTVPETAPQAVATPTRALVKIPGGTYSVGSAEPKPAGFEVSSSSVNVTIPDNLFIDNLEVTNGDYFDYWTAIRR